MGHLVMLLMDSRPAIAADFHQNWPIDAKVRAGMSFQFKRVHPVPTSNIDGFQ